jgi:hypothetical protein
MYCKINFVSPGSNKTVTATRGKVMLLNVLIEVKDGELIIPDFTYFLCSQHKLQHEFRLPVLLK